MRKIAEIPVIMHGVRRLRPVVGATINGVDAKLIFDTGGELDEVFQASTARLQLHPQAPPGGFEMRSFGQTVPFQVAAAHDMKVGDITISPATFLVTDGAIGSGIDGLLGQAFMSRFDVEFDLPDGVIRLFDPNRCPTANLAYWSAAQTVFVVDLEPISTALRPFGEVLVNGVALRALFDSGAPDTDLTALAAARAGVAPGGAGVRAAGTTGGIGAAGGLRNWKARFASLVVGGEAMPNLVLNFTEKPHASADLIIGADYFATHRILISRSQNKLYATAIGPGGLAAQPKGLPSAP